MEAGRGSYFCGLVLGIAVGVAGTHVVLRGRPAHPPARLPDLSIGSPIESHSPRVDFPALESLLPGIRSADAPERATIHAIAIAPAEKTAPVVADAPKQLPAVPDAEPLKLEKPRENAELRAFIRDELQTLAASEHEIWYETLHDLSREDATEILRIWKLTRGDGSLSPLPELTRLAALPIAEIAVAALPTPAAQPSTTSIPTASSIPTTGGISRRQACLHNLANADTPGFKRWDVMAFEELSATSATHHAPRIWLDPSQGTLAKTGRPLDCAIDGSGLFAVTRGEATFYTRCGRLVIDEARRLCVPQPDGSTCPLIPVLTLPEGCHSVVIPTNAAVRAIAGTKEAVDIGRIELVAFLDPAALKPVGGNLLEATAASGPATAQSQDLFSPIVQGCFERSNVDVDAERRRLDSLSLVEPTTPQTAGRAQVTR